MPASGPLKTLVSNVTKLSYFATLGSQEVEGLMPLDALIKVSEAGDQIESWIHNTTTKLQNQIWTNSSKEAFNSIEANMDIPPSSADRMVIWSDYYDANDAAVDILYASLLSAVDTNEIHRQAQNWPTKRWTKALFCQVLDMRCRYESAIKQVMQNTLDPMLRREELSRLRFSTLAKFKRLRLSNIPTDDHIGAGIVEVPRAFGKERRRPLSKKYFWADKPEC
jgi:hypothetical protein